MKGIEIERKKRTMKSKRETKKGQADNQNDESFVSPRLSDAERLKVNREFAEVRRRAESEKSDDERLFAKVLQLKFQMEDYVKSDKLDEQMTFGYFLKQYIEASGRKNNEFAEDIDVNPTELSQIINKHRDPSSKIIMRLEAHSNGIILAFYWHCIYSKDKTLELISNDRLRMEEGKRVKRRLELSL